MEFLYLEYRISYNSIKYSELTLLLVILLGLASQIKIFGKAPSKSKAS
jgi:hypothetical protein